MNTYQEIKKKNPELASKYTSSLNMSYMMAMVADSYAITADDILRKTIQYRLENKKLFSRLKSLLGKLLKNAEGLDEKNDEAFMNSVDFIMKVFNTLSEKNMTKEDEIKLISHIKNNFK